MRNIRIPRILAIYYLSRPLTQSA